jgi:DNA-binding HxlR family transcriptional regulator
MSKKKQHAEELYFSTIELISKKWTLLILHVAAETGRVRFSEFAEHLSGLNTRILSQRLTELEQAGLLSRVVENGKPVAVYYQLTKKAEDLNKVFIPLIKWANKWSHGKKIPDHS